MQLFLAFAPGMSDEDGMRRLLVALLFTDLSLCRGAWADAALTAMEVRWLEAGWPVLQQAQALRLPLDIVVQPQDAPGAVPLAMAYIEGRCKLVLTMRGNPVAADTLAAMPPELQPVLLQAITAHELAHCWRYVQGAWHALPAGFAESPMVDVDRALQHDLRDMQRTRREEGFADLVALAWTSRAHPERYAAVHAWFVAFRATSVPGSHHDTQAWLRLVERPQAFDAAMPLFEQAMTPWRRGLADDD